MGFYDTVDVHISIRAREGYGCTNITYGMGHAKELYIVEGGAGGELCAATVS